MVCDASGCTPRLDYQTQDAIVLSGYEVLVISGLMLHVGYQPATARSIGFSDGGLSFFIPFMEQRCSHLGEDV